MLKFIPDLPDDGTVLCLGAHCDDIEIGCGGALIELRRRYPQLRFHWVVFSGDEERERETRTAAVRLLDEGGHLQVEVQRFRGSYFPYLGGEIKDAFEALRRRVSPDLVFTHFINDRHQDHRVLSDLTWNTFRDHLILEYEIPKYDGDFGSPNCFAQLSRRTGARKIKYLQAAFGSQRDKHWFSAETFQGVMRLRGMECRAPEGYAEGFYARKLVLEL